MAPDNTKLVEDIIKFQMTGEFTDSLYKRLLFIARGSTKGRMPDCDRDDFEQDCIFTFLRRAHKIDTANHNPFNYISTTFINLCNHRKYQKKFAAIEPDAEDYKLAPDDADGVVIRGLYKPHYKPPKFTDNKRRYKYQGRRRTVREISKRSGLKMFTIYSRLRNIEVNSEVTELVAKPISYNFHKYLYQGEMLTVNEIVARCGVVKETLVKRLRIAGVQNGDDVTAHTYPAVAVQLRYRYQCEMLSLKELLAVSGLKRTTLERRMNSCGIQNGDDITELIYQPVKPQYQYQGEILSLKELVALSGLKRSTVEMRIRASGVPNGGDVSALLYPT